MVSPLMHAQPRSTAGRGFVGVRADTIHVGEPDDRDGVGKVRMIVARAEDQKAPSLQPFDRGSAVHDDARNGRMCRLGEPAPHESVERPERWFGCPLHQYAFGSIVWLRLSSFSYPSAPEPPRGCCRGRHIET